MTTRGALNPGNHVAVICLRAPGEGAERRRQQTATTLENQENAAGLAASSHVKAAKRNAAKYTTKRSTRKKASRDSPVSEIAHRFISEGLQQADNAPNPAAAVA